MLNASRSVHEEADMERQARQPDTDILDVAVVLLLLQGAIGLLTAIGLLVLVVATGALGMRGGSVLAPAVATVGRFIFAAALARRQRWGLVGAVALNGLTLAGGALTLIVHLKTGIALTTLLSNIVLPVLVMWLLLTPAARAATRRTAPTARASRISPDRAAPAAPGAAAPHRV
jgi:hypothetical protein